MAAADPVSWLRLAAAAAGAGRVDEALRIERQVATAEGTPGPNDPRAWARMLSAARLGAAARDATPAPGQAESASRKLKELGVLTGPAALVVLTWEDYGASLSLVGLDGDKETPMGEATRGLPVGLTALLLPASDVAAAQVDRAVEERPARPRRRLRGCTRWSGTARRSR